ncbi:unnamed protein product [marine sediment metagenome]|uniref:PylC N-terminal domain-containing protein n=1 Tax=marine sediment metagenome TaxID=412755 RepID=X1HL97_9ZZZZ
MVTGIGGGCLGEQIIKALRLAPVKYEIIGGDMSSLSKGLMEIDCPYLLPQASHPDYIDCLLSVFEKHNVRALFVGSEPELKVVSKARNKISETGIFLPINPESVIDTCLDKSKTIKFLYDHGFFFPETITVSSLEDVEKIQFLPAVLKPSIGGSGSSNVFIA